MVGYPDHYVQSAERHPWISCPASSRNGAGSGVAGVEMDNYWFSAAAFASLVAHCQAPASRISALVNWQRAVKSPAELDYMRTAGRIVAAMHQRIVEKVEPGMRKYDLVAEIYDAGIRGVDGFGGDYAAIVPLLPPAPKPRLRI